MGTSQPGPMAFIRRMPLIGILSFALVCPSCFAQRPAPESEGPLFGTPQLRLEIYFNSANSMFGTNRDQIVANLGKPRLVRTRREPSRHSNHNPEIYNDIVVLEYDGLSIELFGRFRRDIAITSNKYRLPLNLNVGSSRHEIRRVLGNPSKSDDSRDLFFVVHYDADGNPIGYEDLVTIDYHGDRVSRIRFQQYID